MRVLQLNMTNFDNQLGQLSFKKVHRNQTTLALIKCV